MDKILDKAAVANRRVYDDAKASDFDINRSLHERIMRDHFEDRMFWSAGGSSNLSVV